MASPPFHLKLITPEARLIDDEVTYVQLPLHDGQAGFLAHRAPLMAKLGLGELRVDFAAGKSGGGGGSHSYLLEGGFAQMVGNHLTLLAERAIPVEQLNEGEARAELAEAESRNATGADLERVTRERELARTKVRLAQRFKAQGGAI